MHPDRQYGYRQSQINRGGGSGQDTPFSALVSREIPVIPEALVIGGGIAGIQAALDLARCRF